MRVFYQTLCLCCCLLCRVLGQTGSPILTSQPTFPRPDAEVTLIFDLKQAKDSRAKALLGKTDDVYLWAGAGSTETGNAFEFQPAGQTDFAKPFAAGKLTSLGNDRWQIKLVPQIYFGVPAGKPIRRLGLLLKSGDGKAQTEDVFAQLYNGSLSLLRLAPIQKDLFAEPNQPFTVRYRASQRATMTLRVDGQIVATTLDQDSLRFVLQAARATDGRRTVVLSATTLMSSSAESVSDTFYLSMIPEPTIQALPANIVDGINYVGTAPTNPGKAILVLYAPKKSFVHLLGEFNNWSMNPAYLMNRTPDGNRYWIELPLKAGETTFQYLVDGTIAVADPYSEKILDRTNDKFIPAATYPNLIPFPEKASGNIVSVLQPGQAPFAFQATNFQRPAVNTMVVYELLVRDFVQNRNYKTLTDSLAYLKRLGINTIELMPINEFSGNDSWGYNPTFYFAPDKAYGTKESLKRFIDAAHKLDIAVVLDMVLNHADYEFPYAKMYWAGDRPSADSPYFNQQATHPFSVFSDFNHESPDTKAFVDRVCRFWLQEYNIDGFRFDLSKGFTQKNTGSNVAAWSAYDPSRVAIWKRIYDQIRAVDPSALVILEHFADAQEEKELANHGMLLWGNHNGDYRSATRTGQGNPDGISHQKRGFVQPNLIGYAESHDEERLVYDLRQNGAVSGAYNIKSLPTALNRAKLAAAFLLAVPGPKMIWQFGELGYDLSINTCPDGTLNDNCRTAAKPVRWVYYQEADRRKLFKVYAELIKLKTTVPAFATRDFTADFGGAVKRLTLRNIFNTVYLIGNFDTKPQTVTINFPSIGKWYHYFSGQEINVTVTSAYQSITLEPGAFHLYSTARLPTPEAGLVPFTVVPSLVTDTEPEIEGQILISPNPADTDVVVALTSTYRGLVEFRLRDAGGRTLQTLRSQKTAPGLHQPIDLQSLAPGTYLLQVQQGGQQQVVKVLKR